MQAIYKGQYSQFLYSAARNAVAEYHRSTLGTWRFDGWLWDGSVTNAADAKAKLAGLLDSFPTMGE